MKINWKLSENQHEKTVSIHTYIMPPHQHVEAQIQQSKTIANMEKHEQ